MKLEIEINNTCKIPIKKTLVKRIVTRALEESGCSFLQKKIVSLSLAWVDEKEICQMNKVYRKKNRATDVLSFCEYEDVFLLKKSEEDELFLGEIILCYNHIRALMGAGVTKKELEREIGRVIAHGVLHLLCFKHSKKMFDIQNKVAEEI